jgi:hypothetical protein
MHTSPFSPNALVLPLFFLTAPCSGFVLATDRRQIGFHRSPTTLPAKKGGRNKKKRGVTGAGGGFGRSAVAETTKAPEGVDDFTVFPALEASVMKTLVPADEKIAGGEGGDLPREIYDRLDQIYGFPNFNCRATVDETPESSTSLMDIMAESSTTACVNSDLDDLLATATGATKKSMPPEKEEEGDLSSSLSQLPPFEKIRVLHVDPLVLAIDDFFTEEQCDRYVAKSDASSRKKKGTGTTVLESRSPTVGKDSAAKAQRTSTTYYHHYESVPELMAKASKLLGLRTLDQFEEPQTVRYRTNEKFTWHLDALGPAENDLASGGQRIATLLVYLTGLEDSDGGATLFRDLGRPAEEGGPQYLRVQPQKGSALLFFPAAGGIPHAPLDFRTLHCGEAVAKDASQDKWIAQLWLRQKAYTPTAPPGNTHAAALPLLRDVTC